MRVREAHAIVVALLLLSVAGVTLIAEARSSRVVVTAAAAIMADVCV